MFAVPGNAGIGAVAQCEPLDITRPAVVIDFVEAGATVVIEESLRGEELSILCLTDGRHVLPLAPAQDFKRASDGDRGPNTGGMGSYSPVPSAPGDLVSRAVRDVFEPVVRTL